MGNQGTQPNQEKSKPENKGFMPPPEENIGKSEDAASEKGQVRPIKQPQPEKDQGHKDSPDQRH